MNFIFLFNDNHLKAIKYHNDPKISDRQVWAIRVDPDQTGPRGAV